MKRESSRKDISNSRFKVLPKDKFASRRRIIFPKETFIELRLSKAQVEKVKKWQRNGDIFLPMWYASCARVLFVNEQAFHEWLLRKEKP